MNARKKLCSLIPMLMPGVGFVLTCAGGSLLSNETQHGQAWNIVPAYFMILLGFVLMIVGVFWTMCQSFQRKQLWRRRAEQRIQVFTVERLSSYPPSYEESEGRRVPAGAEFVMVVDGVDVAMSLAPPLYSCDGSDAPDCRWSWEQPPRYSQVERTTRQGEGDTDERMEASSGP